MSRPQSSCARFRAYAWPVLLLISISLVSGTSNPQLPGGLTFHDKLAHFMVFGLLATTLIRFPVFAERKVWMLCLSILIPSLLGFFDELHQSFTPGRTMEFLDWVADTAGAIVAVCAYHWLGPYRRLLEYSASFR